MLSYSGIPNVGLLRSTLVIHLFQIDRNRPTSRCPDYKASNKFALWFFEKLVGGSLTSKAAIDRDRLNPSDGNPDIGCLGKSAKQAFTPGYHF